MPSGARGRGGGQRGGGKRDFLPPWVRHAAAVCAPTRGRCRTLFLLLHLHSQLRRAASSAMSERSPLLLVRRLASLRATSALLHFLGVPAAVLTGSGTIAPRGMWGHEELWRMIEPAKPRVFCAALILECPRASVLFAGAPSCVCTSAVSGARGGILACGRAEHQAAHGATESVAVRESPGGSSPC